VSESDGTGSDVTGIDVIRPEVGDYPWGVILIVRGVVWYSNGVFFCKYNISLYPWHEMIGIVSVWNPKKPGLLVFKI
jgi:hypothetical protein